VSQTTFGGALINIFALCQTLSPARFSLVTDASSALEQCLADAACGEDTEMEAAAPHATAAMKIAFVRGFKVVPSSRKRIELGLKETFLSVANYITGGARLKTGKFC